MFLRPPHRSTERGVYPRWATEAERDLVLAARPPLERPAPRVAPYRVFSARRAFALIAALGPTFPAAAGAWGLIVPEPSDSSPAMAERRDDCVALYDQTVELEIEPGAAESIATTSFAVGEEGMRATIIVPGIGEGRAPDVELDDARVELTLLESDQATRFLVDLATRRKTPALVAATGIPAAIARVELSGGLHRLVVRSAPVVEWNVPVPRVIEPIRSLDTACATPPIGIHATIRSAAPIGAVFTPYHDRTVERPDPRTAIVNARTSPGEACHDFHMYLSMSEEKVAAAALTYRDAICAGEAGDLPGYMVVAAGPTAMEAEEAVAKDVALVIDKSGSMAGRKIEQVRDALLAILERLGPEDRFELITFDGDVHAAFGELRGASDVRALEEARAIAGGMVAEGSTNIHDALLRGLEELVGGHGRPRMILFLTDGEATSGVTETDAILTAVRAANELSTRIFTFGVGDSVNTRLLDALARESGASARYIRPFDDIDAVLSSFYTEVEAPIATDLELVSEGITVRDRFPERLPDLFVGTHMFALARYDASSASRLSISAETSAGRETFAVGGSILSQGVVHSFIPRLWASRLLGELLFEARQNGGQEETVQRIRELASMYGFVTRWTPFAVDAEGNVDRDYNNPTGAEVGSDAVGTSAAINDISANSNAGAYSADGAFAPIRQVLDRTFVRRHGYWVDTRAPSEVEDADIIDITFGSASWVALVETAPEMRELLGVGRSLTFEWSCRLVRVTDPSEHGGAAPAEDRIPEDLLLPRGEDAVARIPGKPAPSAGGLDLDEGSSCRSAGGGSELALPLLLAMLVGVGRSISRARR